MRQLGGVGISPVQRSGGTNPWLTNLSTLPNWFYTVFWIAGGPLSLAESGLAIVGIGLALRDKTPKNRLLITIALGALVPFGVATRLRWIQYGALWSPFWYLLGVAGLSRLAKWATEHLPILTVGVRQVMLPVVIGSLAAGNIAGDGWLVYRYRGGNYTEMEAGPANVIPSGSRVLADPVWWWVMRQGRTFMSEDYVALVTLTGQSNVRQFLGVQAGVSTQEAFEALLHKLKPDYVVVDGALGCQAEPGTTWQHYWRHIQDTCRLIGKVEGAWILDPTKTAIQIGQVANVYACNP